MKKQLATQVGIKSKAITISAAIQLSAASSVYAGFVASAKQAYGARQDTAAALAKDGSKGAALFQACMAGWITDDKDAAQRFVKSVQQAMNAHKMTLKTTGDVWTIGRMQERVTSIGAKGRKAGKATVTKVMPLNVNIVTAWIVKSLEKANPGMRKALLTAIDKATAKYRKGAKVA